MDSSSNRDPNESSEGRAEATDTLGDGEGNRMVLGLS